MDGSTRFLPELQPLQPPAAAPGTRFDPRRVGYGAEEYLMRGEARAFEPRDASVHAVRVGGTASYCTRLIVLRPLDRETFNGTAVVEWVNVRGGMDFVPEWMRCHREIMRKGMIWVGVCAQTPLAQGARLIDRDRYGGLQHPGNAYAFDIFSQAGQLLRAGAFPGPPPDTLLAVGSSEAARFLTTYVNRIDPEAMLFDGFMLTGRHMSAASLGGDSIAGERTLIRSDARAPVFVLQPETDPFARMRSFEVRQPDSERFRLWEIAGAAHGDTYTLSAGAIDDGLVDPAALAAAYAPHRVVWVRPQRPLNASPCYTYVERTALHHLERWARDGLQPPCAPKLAGTPESGVERDALGVARGGVRTPWVDCPWQVFSGVNDETGEIEALFGWTGRIPAEVLHQLYPGGVEDYLKRFEVSLRRTIDAGFILPEDAAEILDLARIFAEEGDSWR